MYCTNCGRKLPEDGSPCICGGAEREFQHAADADSDAAAALRAAAVQYRCSRPCASYAGTRDVKTVCVVKAVFHVRAAFYGADGRVGGLIGD